jgi:membrane protein implicated in regulation of membrane protease activity
MEPLALAAVIAVVIAISLVAGFLWWRWMRRRLPATAEATERANTVLDRAVRDGMKPPR